MGKEERDYQKDTSIDLNNLEKELARNPRLVADWGEEAADAKRVLARASENVKTIRSELILKMSQHPDVYGLTKTTDKMIEAAYRTHEDYIEAKEEWIEAEYDYTMLSDAKWNAIDKKEILKEEVKWWINEYFIGSGEPNDITDWKPEEGKRSRTSRDQRQRMKRTKN